MPLYEYQCESCGGRFEVIQRFSDDPVQDCRACGKGPVHRLISSPAIHFKGTGWYITDYARKGNPDTGGAASASSSSSTPAPASSPTASSTPATPASTTESKSGSSGADGK